jgi:hypothetical protein
MSASEQHWPTRITDTDILAGSAIDPEQTIRIRTAQSKIQPKGGTLNRVAAGIVVLVLAVVIALAGWLLTDRDTHTPAAAAAENVAVPRLTGLDEQTAVIKLANAGFKPKIHLLTTGPADGLVAYQLPPLPVRLTPGTAVLLYIDRPATAAQARALKRAVAPKKVKHVKQVAVAPPVPVLTTVPDVSSDPEQAAVQALNNAKLVASLFFVPSHDPLGTVEGQAKAAGTQVATTSPMQINISEGPGKNPAETVPNVVGKTLDDALAALNGQQLRLIFLKQRVPIRTEAGVINRQSPLPGAHVPRHGQVLVYLAAFPSGD